MVKFWEKLRRAPIGRSKDFEVSSGGSGGDTASTNDRHFIHIVDSEQSSLQSRDTNSFQESIDAQSTISIKSSAKDNCDCELTSLERDSKPIKGSLQRGKPSAVPSMIGSAKTSKQAKEKEKRNKEKAGKGKNKSTGLNFDGSNSAKERPLKRENLGGNLGPVEQGRNYGNVDIAKESTDVNKWEIHVENEHDKMALKKTKGKENDLKKLKPSQMESGISQKEKLKREKEEMKRREKEEKERKKREKEEKKRREKEKRNSFFKVFDSEDKRSSTLKPESGSNVLGYGTRGTKAATLKLEVSFPEQTVRYRKDTEKRRSMSEVEKELAKSEVDKRRSFHIDKKAVPESNVKDDFVVPASRTQRDSIPARHMMVTESKKQRTPVQDNMKSSPTRHQSVGSKPISRESSLQGYDPLPVRSMPSNDLASGFLQRNYLSPVNRPRVFSLPSTTSRPAKGAIAPKACEEDLDDSLLPSPTVEGKDQLRNVSSGNTKAHWQGPKSSPFEEDIQEKPVGVIMKKAYVCDQPSGKDLVDSMTYPSERNSSNSDDKQAFQKKRNTSIPEKTIPVSTRHARGHMIETKPVHAPSLKSSRIPQPNESLHRDPKNKKIELVVPKPPVLELDPAMGYPRHHSAVPNSSKIAQQNEKTINISMCDSDGPKQQYAQDKVNLSLTRKNDSPRSKHSVEDIQGNSSIISDASNTLSYTSSVHSCSSPVIVSEGQKLERSPIFVTF